MHNGMFYILPVLTNCKGKKRFLNISWLIDMEGYRLSIASICAFKGHIPMF